MAWQAHKRGWPILIADRFPAGSCSRVAAGLVTPITGTRGALSWEWQWFFREASQFYPWVESVTLAKFWYPQPSIRLFRCPEEHKLYTDRWFTSASNQGKDPELEVGAYELNGIAELAQGRMGGCELKPAARLDTNMYLDATKSYFQSRGELLEMNIDVAEVTSSSTATRIKIPSLDCHADAIVFCQGFNASRQNPWFENLPLHPARGDILTIETSVRIPGVLGERVVHHDAWVVPLGGNRYRVGATYDRHILDGVVDDRPEVANWRLELEERWIALLSELEFQTDWRVVAHEAAVRPASYDRKPLLGRSAVQQNAFCINGLGSKGSLMSPQIADHLLDVMQGKPVDPRLKWSRRK